MWIILFETLGTKPLVRGYFIIRLKSHYVPPGKTSTMQFAIIDLRHRQQFILDDSSISVSDCRNYYENSTSPNVPSRNS